jgi:cytochrome c-type biogenesis protein CcmH
VTTRTRQLTWGALALVVVAALAVGSWSGGEATDAQRTRALEERIRCPRCASQSVAQSETPSARGVKVVIRDQVEAGRSDEEILDFVASRYGRDVLLDTPGSGFSALVWVLPVAVSILAVTALVYRFRDWRPGATRASDADRDLVGAELDRRRRAGADAPGRTRR